MTDKSSANRTVFDCTLSHPSGGNCDRNRLIRGEASGYACKSSSPWAGGEPELLSSECCGCGLPSRLLGKKAATGVVHSGVTPRSAETWSRRFDRPAGTGQSTSFSISWFKPSTLLRMHRLPGTCTGEAVAGKEWQDQDGFDATFIIFLRLPMGNEAEVCDPWSSCMGFIYLFRQYESPLASFSELVAPTATEFASNVWVALENFKVRVEQRQPNTSSPVSQPNIVRMWI